MEILIYQLSYYISDINTFIDTRFYLYNICLSNNEDKVRRKQYNIEICYMLVYQNYERCEVNISMYLIMQNSYIPVNVSTLSSIYI